MEIKELYDVDYKKYNELAISVGSIFNTTDWTNIFGKSLQHFGIYNKGNRLIGGFFIYKEKKFGLSLYHNPLYTPFIGPFLKIEAQNPVNIASTWKEAVSLMARFIDKLPYSIVSFSLNTNVKDTQPYIWKKFKVIPVYTYLMDLSLPVDNLWKAMSSVCRNDIIKGEKDGLMVKKVENFEIIKSLVGKSFSRQHMKLNSYFLSKILFEFANSNNSFAFGTYKDNDPIACAFCVFDRHSAYYLLGGYDSDNKHHGAGSLAIWETIKYAKGLGLKLFNFEGSMVPQIERYFRGFGGQLTPYYRINKAKLPIEILLKFFKRELF